MFRIKQTWNGQFTDPYKRYATVEEAQRDVEWLERNADPRGRGKYEIVEE